MQNLLDFFSFLLSENQVNDSDEMTTNENFTNQLFLHPPE